MLVLGRTENEEVIIGSGDNAVRVVVVEIRGGKVRLGFVAPKSVPVFRRELLDNSPPKGLTAD